MPRLTSLSLVIAAVLAVTEASAQQPAVPEQMPFDVPYGPSITADRAAQVVQAVVAEARRPPRNWKLAIAVVDPNGDLVYFYRMDQTQHASNNIAIGKARTAARFRRPTQAFFDVMQTPAGAYVSTLDPTLVASPGGIPLVEGGRIIGAIGCSGAMGSQDHVACQAGANTVR
ncbi:MAG: heme-binding protein [Gemmatimonadetes bacterium]|nr:heme-binding protein [Gemmatimonadota bacterium]